MHMQMKEAVIVSGARTAVGRAPRGALRTTRPDDLAGAAIREALRRAPGLEAAEVEDVILGCATPEGPQGLNVARLAAALGYVALNASNRLFVWPLSASVASYGPAWGRGRAGPMLAFIEDFRPAQAPTPELARMSAPPDPEQSLRTFTSRTGGLAVLVSDLQSASRERLPVERSRARPRKRSQGKGYRAINSAVLSITCCRTGGTCGANRRREVGRRWPPADRAVHSDGAPRTHRPRAP